MEENTCKFCGQVLMEEMDCDCAVAKQERNKNVKLCELKTKVGELLEHRPDQEEIRDLIELLAIAIFDNRIQKLSINLDGNTTIKIHEDSKGNIRIKKEDKETKEEII